MSLNFVCDRFLSCEDDEFVLKVDKDIRDYLNNSLTNSVLLFPPVNSYRRFLIHKVCESVKNESSNRELTTFSIGVEHQRRTVVCRQKQLIADPKATTAKTERSQENEFAWHYLKRNSVPKTFNHFPNDCRSERRNHREPGGRIMGIESVDATTASAQKIISSNCSSVEESSNVETTSLSDDPLSAKKLSRTRRPDRAVYIPRAKRSQTTPPSSSNSNSSIKSHRKKSDRKIKSKSIDESHSSSNSEEPNEEEEGELSSPDCTPVIIPQFDTNLKSCDQGSNQKCEESPTDTKNQKNLQNLCTMSQQTGTELLIENNACAEASSIDKVDKDEKELIKASQEINRSNRKLIKQSFNTNVLEIESTDGATSKDDKAVNQEEDDWDTLFNDNGDCLDPKMVEELTKAVGKVTIEKPKSDYKSYHSNIDLLKGEEFPHVLECSHFPVEWKTQDLMALFAPYAKESGFDIKWVDDTHCLIVFSSAKVAAEVLTASHPIIVLKPLAEATQESRTKARKCSSSLQPYRQRPETCAALAKRLVSGALGVRIKATDEERENERRVLREAKERKLLAAKNRQEREDAWNN